MILFYNIKQLQGAVSTHLGRLLKAFHHGVIEVRAAKHLPPKNKHATTHTSVSHYFDSVLYNLFFLYKAFSITTLFVLVLS